MKIIKRIFYVLLLAIIYPLYFISVIIYVPILYSSIAILAPLSWIIAGDKGVELIVKTLLEKSNNDLWLNESNYYSTFHSILPLWGPFIIKKIKSKLDI